MAPLPGLLAALLVLASTPVAISASQPDPPTRKNPYGQLFKPSPAPAAPVFRPERPAAAKPQVKCGMTIVTVDPSIDPKMVIPPPPSSTKYTIRAVDPPLCR